MRDNRGFTLIELAIVLAITALILPLLATILFQTTILSVNISDRLAVSHDLQYAAYWLSRDTNEAGEFTPQGSPYYGLLAREGSRGYRYRYDVDNTALVREVMLGDTPQQEMAIARHIARYEDVSFTIEGQRVRVTLKASQGQVEESLTLIFTMRRD